MDRADCKCRLGADVKPFDVPTATGKMLCDVLENSLYQPAKRGSKTHGYPGYVPS